jgi:hypothetical protein
MESYELLVKQQSKQQPLLAHQSPFRRLQITTTRPKLSQQNKDQYLYRLRRSKKGIALIYPSWTLTGSNTARWLIVVHT